MPRLERELAAVEETLVTQQPAETRAGLQQAMAEAGGAWRRFRDSECIARTQLDGMTSSAAPEVIQACRVSMTEERLKSLQSLAVPVEGDTQ